MRNRAYVLSLMCVVALLGGACGDDEEKPKDDGPCMLGEPDACEGGLVCEEVMDGDPLCVVPVVIRGRILDINDGSGIADATVVALDINGSARSSVVTSDDDGTYEIGVPVARDESGAPLSGEPVTLQVAAAGYQSFPTLPREALPIELITEPEANDAGKTRALVVMNTATDVGLVALAGDTSQLTTVAGSIDHPLAAGTLVVAVQGDRAVSTAIADRDGAFTLFNVPAGETRIEGYRAGLRIEPETVTTTAGTDAESVQLTADTEALATVSGSVSIVNAEGGLTTSVILVLESTFIQSKAVARGVAPAGLRAGNVSGAFEIEGVPPGKYAVLAAFENDELVRDPDEGISGTDVVHIEVTGDEPTVELSQSFKVTQALAVVSPGRSELTEIPSGEAPTFVWADDSSEDGYELRVFDAFGTQVHEALDIARVNGGENVSYTWQDAELTPGSIYQFRVLSFRDPAKNETERTYISATEDLRGVFQVAGEE